MSDSQGPSRTAHLRDQITDILRDEIAQRRFASGMLPSVRVLARRFAVSTMTISGALDLLQGEGLIERVRGKGVYIRGSDGRSNRFKATTKHLGLVTHQHQNEVGFHGYYAEIWQGILGATAEAGHALVCVEVAFGRELSRVKDVLANLCLDGLLVMAIAGREVVRRLQQLGLPVVVVDHHFDDLAVDCVDIDGYRGSVMVVEHLLGLGHRNVAFLASPNAEKNNPDRWLGWEEGLREAGIDPDEQVLRREVPSDEGGARAARALLAEGIALPGSWYVWHGPMASGFVDTLRAEGIDVPAEVSVVSTGGMQFAQQQPAITASIYHAEELGRHAVKLLLARIDEPERANQQVLIPPELRVAGSTAPPR